MYIKIIDTLSNNKEYIINDLEKAFNTVNDIIKEYRKNNIYCKWYFKSYDTRFTWYIKEF